MAHGGDVVVMAQAAVAGQPGSHALVAAVHGNQVDVDVDQQIRLGRPFVDLNVLAPVRLPQPRQSIGVFGVVLDQQPMRGEGVIDAVANGVAQLRFGHAAMQGQGADEHHVIDPGCGCRVEHGFDDPLPVVRAVHGRKGQGDVVEGDGEPHAGEQQLRQRLAVAARVQKGLPHGLVRIVEGVKRFGRVDHPRPSGRKPLQPKAFAVPGEDRRRGTVHVKHKTGAGHAVTFSFLGGGRRPPSPCPAGRR